MTTSRFPATSSFSVASDLSPGCFNRSNLSSKDQHTKILHESPSERSCTSVESVESAMDDFGKLEISKAQRLSDALRRSALLVGESSLMEDPLLSDGSDRLDFSDRFGPSERSMGIDRLAMSERSVGIDRLAMSERASGSRRHPVVDRLAQSERSFRSGSTGSEKLLDNSSRLSFLMTSSRSDYFDDDLSSSDESDMDEHHHLYED